MASWRAHHGAMTSRNSPRQPDRRGERDRPAVLDVDPAAGAPPAPPPADPVAEPDEADRGAEEDAVVPAQAGEAGQEAGEGIGAPVALQAARRAPERRGDERLHDREVLGLGHEDRRRRGDRARGPRRPWRRSARRATSRAIAQVSGAASEPMIASGRAEASAVGPRTAMNGAWTKLASGQPVGVRGDREDGGIRDPVADLGEDPDEVDVEAVPARDGPRDVDVVVRIRIGRVRVGRDEDQSDDQREAEQGDRSPHGSGA